MDLTHVIDTSGAYIPGHGTPTVILFGRSRKPVGETMRAVLGINGEPSHARRSLAGLGLAVHRRSRSTSRVSQDEFISDGRCASRRRSPTIRGASAAAARRIEGAASRKRLSTRLVECCDSIGIHQVARLKTSVYICRPGRLPKRRSDLPSQLRQMVVGELFEIGRRSVAKLALFPYDDLTFVQSGDELNRESVAICWPLSNTSWRSKIFGGEHRRSVRATVVRVRHRLTQDQARTPLSIAFAFVATHNHFVLDRGGKVFNRRPRSSSCPPKPPKTTTSPCSACSTVRRRASG